MSRESELQSINPSGGDLESLRASLSMERMSKYLGATGGILSDALALYNWNTAVSAAFYGPLQWLEVTLRNSVERCLAETFGDAWYYQEGAELDYICRRDLRKARERLERDGKPIARAEIVAALSFGFWVTLLGRGGVVSKHGARANFEMTLWRPALHKAFPNRPGLSRKQAYRPLYNLRMLRNRIAHHEAIFERDLRLDHESIIRMTGWISSPARTWIETHSRVPELLAARRDIMMKF